MLASIGVRASIQDLKNVIKSAGVPRQITQQPFDFNPKHYRRLCNADAGEPDAGDLLDYALDLKYMELQPDLLRHLTPVLLQAWRRDLFEGGSAGYAGFVQQFWPALLKGKALNGVFSAIEKQAFATYMRNTILDRLDAEASLRFSGMNSSPYVWVAALVAYGTLFSDMDVLWNEWWQMQTEGHAIGAFQYVSALQYPDEQNPVFAAWTPEAGGGPPALWDCGALMYDVGWQPENLGFLKRTLTVDYLHERLPAAISQIHNGQAKRIAETIVQDLPARRARLELRIEELPQLLTDVSRVEGFTI